MKSLLTDLDAVAGKTAYQSYTVTHGIETLTVLVPLAEAAVFEAEFAGAKNKTKQLILEMVKRHSGKIKG